MRALLAVLSMLAAAPVVAAEPPAGARKSSGKVIPTCPRKTVTWAALPNELHAISACNPVKQCQFSWIAPQSFPIGNLSPYLMVGPTSQQLSVAAQNSAVANAKSAAAGVAPQGKDLIWISYYTGSVPLQPQQTRLSGIAHFAQCSASME